MCVCYIVIGRCRVSNGPADSMVLELYDAVLVRFACSYMGQGMVSTFCLWQSDKGIAYAHGENPMKTLWMLIVCLFCCPESYCEGAVELEIER